MPRPGKRSGPAVSDRALSTPPSDIESLTPQADELLEELRRIKAENGDLFTALLNGTYRLSLPCDCCGRYLTSHRSKAAGRGPVCAAKAVAR
jgi:hypothetical protein